MGRIRVIGSALSVLIALMSISITGHAQSREERAHSFELSVSGGVGLTSHDASLASIRRADAEAYRGVRPLLGLSFGYVLPDRSTSIGLEWANISIEANLRDNTILSRAGVNLYGLRVADYRPILTEGLEFLTFGTVGLAHGYNSYSTLEDGTPYGKAQALGVGVKLGCGLRFRLSSNSAVELQGGAIESILFKWRGDEAVIRPEAYSYGSRNSYGLFYTSLSYSILF